MNNIGQGIHAIDYDRIKNTASGIASLTEALSELYDEDFGDLDVISQLQSLSQIDSSKIITLAEAIAKLSESFTGLNGVLASMGNIDPVIKVTDKVIELHDQLSEGPISEMVNTVTSGVKTLYDKGTEFVSNLFNDGAIQMRDGVVQVQDGNLNPNGGLVVSKYQKGQLQPIAQGIKEDNVYLTPNKPMSKGGGATVVQDNTQVIAAIQALTNAITNSNKTVELIVDGQKLGTAVTPTVLATAKKTSVNI